MSRRGKPKLGRPPLPKGETKATIFSIRLSPEERAAIEAKATADGLKASEWARRILLEAATVRAPK